MTDPDDIFEQVVDVAEGRVGGAEASEVLRRIAADPRWRAVHEWVTTFLADASRAVLVPVPASTRETLEHLLPPRRTLTDSVRDTVGSIARLVRDVPAGAAFAGARGAAGTRRQLLFTMDDGADLALELEQRDDGLAITGQLLGGELAYRVELTSDFPTIMVTSDEVGEFGAVTPVATFLRLDVVTADGRAVIDLTPFLDDHHQGDTR